MDEDISFPHAPFTVKLSAFDTRWWVCYSRRILIFRTNAPKQDIVANVKRAVSLLVKRCPALGGVMTRPEFKGPNGQEGWRRVVAGNGIRLVVKDLSDKLDLTSLGADNFPPAKLSDELLIPVPLKFSQEPYQVLVLQLSLIDGGVLMSFCIAHGITDGGGMTAITDMFAECCKVSEDPETANAKFPVVNIDNSVLNGATGTKTRWEDHPACRPIEAPSSLQVTPLLKDESPQTIRIYRITEERLEKLKSAATKDRISTNDAIFALMWRLIMRVRIATGFVVDNPNLEVHFVVATGTRKFLGLEPSHIGNLSYLTIARIPLGKLLAPDGLTEAAARIRKVVNAVDKDTILSLARLVEDMPELSIPEGVCYARNQDVVVTPISLFHAGELLLQSDWGQLLGHRAVRLRCADKGFWPTPGGHFVLPRMPDGQGGEVQFQLTENGFRVLENDELFIRYLER